MEIIASLVLFLVAGFLLSIVYSIIDFDILPEMLLFVETTIVVAHLVYWANSVLNLI